MSPSLECLVHVRNAPYASVLVRVPMLRSSSTLLSYILLPSDVIFPAGLRPTAQMHLNACCPLQGLLHHSWFSKKEVSYISFSAHSWLTGLGLRLGPDAPVTTAPGVLVLDGPAVVDPSGEPVDQQLTVCTTDIVCSPWL